MTGEKDIRWEQRFSNYNKALKKLSEAIGYVKNKPKEEVLDEILKEGIIHRFKYTHELAWNVMKDFLLEIGDVTLYGSKDATREAFKTELIKDGDVWMEMIKSRNKTSHTYNEEIAQEIYLRILNEYHSAFIQFQEVMEGKKSGEQRSVLNED
jgi:nucleotidyltransferase substrate binding protein (TIGR01987 family)